MSLTEKPTHIKHAVILIAVSLGLGLPKIALDYDYLLSLGSIQNMAIMLIFAAAVTLFFAYKINQGRNWARIVFTVFFVLGTVPTILLLPIEVDRSMLLAALTALQVLLQAGSIALMYLPQANNWFKSIKLADNKAEVASA